MKNEQNRPAEANAPYVLGEVEGRFASLVWAHAPLPSGELVGLCKEALGWSKSTTYTVLRKLCEKGFFKNEGGEVQVVLTEADYRLSRGEAAVRENYGGSLPAFIAAFAAKNRLTNDELDDIRRLIDAYRRGERHG
ncbi:MAG: BlaI/MecI/CopY family transcriptional regulator [Clostridia bacterium]|nr:BlaI/MecI/CopY family transcriptional regulator [Clostridia bacterium]